jgi:hypothetical protein
LASLIKHGLGESHELALIKFTKECFSNLHCFRYHLLIILKEGVAQLDKNNFKNPELSYGKAQTIEVVTTRG